MSEDEVNYQNFRGNTALHYACSMQRQELINQLCNAGSKSLANIDGHEPKSFLEPDASQISIKIAPATHSARVRTLKKHPIGVPQVNFTNSAQR